MPLQRVVERDALTDEPFAVIDQQPQVELGPFQVRGRQRVQAFAQRRAGDGDRVDAVGLAALARRRAARGHQRAVDPQNTFSALDQKPLQGARHMPAVLQRPHPLGAQPSRPAATTRRTHGADLDRLSPSSSPVTEQPRRSCASACACPPRARS